MNNKYTEIKQTSLTPCNRKGTHNEEIVASLPYGRDKELKNFLDRMTASHGDNFVLHSVTKPNQTKKGFTAQISYTIL